MTLPLFYDSMKVMFVGTVGVHCNDDDDDDWLQCLHRVLALKILRHYRSWHDDNDDDDDSYHCCYGEH